MGKQAKGFITAFIGFMIIGSGFSIGGPGGSMIIVLGFAVGGIGIAIFFDGDDNDDKSAYSV